MHPLQDNRRNCLARASVVLLACLMLMGVAHAQSLNTSHTVAELDEREFYAKVVGNGSARQRLFKLDGCFSISPMSRVRKPREAGQYRDHL